MKKAKKLVSIAIAVLMLMTTIAVPVAMAEVNTGTNTGTACGTCGSGGCKTQKSVDKEIQDKILESITKEISIPKDYDLIAAPDDTGFALIYSTSSTSKTIVEISPSYEIKEIWTSTISELQSGRNIVLTSDKGKEMSITYAYDPSSNKGKVAVYDSSTGEVTTLSLCTDVCVAACEPLVGVACSTGCYAICLANLGIPYWVCVTVCLYNCQGTISGCDGLCWYICN